ncbi:MULTISPECIES: DUF3137 domain-containing protein [unclassified Microbacterium]|uniref:DUF3137 domain-containing protein n=1 Tax=unclassified Microbacterium TaxID=2609290 RepID=UPI00214AF17E|nr:MULTISPECIES: DUF3137 domain-containing protein [unclassified Microbacterium]MCR2783079.1 DUF3137 domain-containing protein [Microbacterium sp. zg.B96]WIM16036.1 DUF3137 domain-containing protein [Microbacterium sp. zg-B96]
MTTPAASVQFDPRALSEPVDRATIIAHKKHLIAAGRAPRAGEISVATVVTIVVVLLIAGSFASMGGIFFSFIAAGGGLFGLFSLVPILILGGVIAIVVVIAVRSSHTAAERWYRLDRFAAANGLTWYPEVKAPGLPGMIFGQGDGRTATDILRGEQPRFVEFANYRYTTSSGKNTQTHRWGYIAIKLNAPLPHIVLDAVGNNGMLGSNLPTSFDKGQRLSLEGDFDRYFTLYCPAGYERDALYLFTPDIMTRFIDNAAALDVEIVDDWLFLYARRDFSTFDPRMWAWLFSVVATLLDKLEQWERWRDERLVAPMPAPALDHGHAQAQGHAQYAQAHAAAGGAQALPFTAPPGVLQPPPGVSPTGRRLQRRVPWATIIILSVIGVVWLGLQIAMSGIFGVFG